METNPEKNRAGTPADEQSPAPAGSPFERCRLTDPTVHRMLRYGASMEDVVVQLVAEKEMLFSRLRELEAIAPKRIAGPDGREWIYRCPDALVPSENARAMPPATESDHGK